MLEANEAVVMYVHESCLRPTRCTPVVFGLSGEIKKVELIALRSILCVCVGGVHTLRPGAPVAQWVKRWPTDLADRVRSSLEVKSSQP